MALSDKKNNRKCIVCNCSYYHCGHCNEPIKPSWYNIFHDQNCHDIYNAVANIYPEQGKDAAKEALDKLDLSNKESFHPNIVRLINEIYDIKDVVDVVDNVIIDDTNRVNIEIDTTENKVEEKVNVEIKVDEPVGEQVTNKTETQPEAKVEKEEKEVNKTVTSNTKPNSSTAAKKVSRNTKNKK